MFVRKKIFKLCYFLFPDRLILFSLCTYGIIFFASLVVSACKSGLLFYFPQWSLNALWQQRNTQRWMHQQLQQYNIAKHDTPALQPYCANIVDRNPGRAVQMNMSVPLMWIPYTTVKQMLETGKVFSFFLPSEGTVLARKDEEKARRGWNWVEQGGGRW